MAEQLTADYLVVGAGATGMGFTDALIDHCDARVVLVDRRPAPGGHWLDAYPFVRLHQSSSLYGVASTRLGEGRAQTRGPEAGWHERATAPEICAYYGRVLRDRMVESDRVSFHPGCEYVGEGRFVSLVSGTSYEVRGAPRIVDARFLAPEIPATTPPPFGVAEGVRVVAVNGLARLDESPSQFVVVGSGKTASDACTWLLENGVDPDRICWVRPRDPWLLSRAVTQPDPVVYITMAADTMAAAAVASSADDMFLRMEAAGIMLRIDRTVVPRMAHSPTIAQWEVDLLATIQDVVRLGHLVRAEPGRLVLQRGEVPVARDAVIVHCAASGLRFRPPVPIWGPDAIRVQPLRAGLPCLAAAITGYVEATLDDDDEKNRLCRPSTLPNSPDDWLRMQVLGMRASMSFRTNRDVRQWADGLYLNPSRVPPDITASAAGDLAAARERFRAQVGAGVDRMAQLAGMA